MIKGLLMFRGALRLPRRAFFVGFYTDFVTSVKVSAGVLVRGA